jgi:hypothetical protein
MDLLSPDDVASIMDSPFVTNFWPMIVGAIVILVFLIRGYTRTTIPIFAISLFAQAWHMGFFGPE